MKPKEIKQAIAIIELHRSLEQLSRYQFICQGTGIEWPELDYH
jgi:hypothetical protein